MAEGGYDPCECICGHEHAMRRLLSFIQMSSSQSDCTQNQCFSNLFDGSDENSWLVQTLIWVLLWLVLLLALYMFRPKSLQGKQPSAQEPRPPLPPPVQ
ncbi:small integral membrane protein 14-like [Dysidea avara]|uniref:small integral membrane protein 14-like n=1 Tax=Dysidea avara TaxID=196820 RepID=UPI00332DBBDC